MIEHLEARIAPAAVLTFTEVDGDKIKIATSKGTKAELIAAFNGGIGDKATGIDAIALDLTTTTDFNGANLTISVLKKAKAGDGLADDVNITGYSATLAEGHSNIFLKNVSIQGNLTAISAGDTAAQLAVNKITTTYWGPITDGVTAVASTFLGDIGTILVKKDFNGSIVSASDYTNSDVGIYINNFSIGRNLANTIGDENGHIQVSVINKLTVAGTFFGPGATAAGNGVVNDGVIQAIAIVNSYIADMEEGAKIDLAFDTAPSQVSPTLKG